MGDICNAKTDFINFLCPKIITLKNYFQELRKIYTMKYLN